MRNSYFRITILLLMLFVISGLQAQNKLYIHTKDGTTSSFPLNEIRKLTFPSRTIGLYPNEGNMQSFPFIELRQARFTQFVSANNSLDLPETNTLTLFPNPVGKELTLMIGSASGGLVEIRILDVQGKTVCLQKEHLLPGTRQISMQLSDLPQGLYVCRVINGKSTETRKFLKN